MTSHFASTTALGDNRFNSPEPDTSKSFYRLITSLFLAALDPLCRRSHLGIFQQLPTIQNDRIDWKYDETDKNELPKSSSEVYIPCKSYARVSCPKVVKMVTAYHLLLKESKLIVLIYQVWTFIVYGLNLLNASLSIFCFGSCPFNVTANQIH